MGETEMPILEVKVGNSYSDELNQGIQHRGKAKKTPILQGYRCVKL